LVLTAYVKQCPQYPDGAKVVTAGESVLERRSWVGTRGGKREALDLPVVQLRQFRGAFDDPHGRGLMDFLGSANELRLHLVGVIQDTLDRNANRKVFIPTNSILQSKAQQLPFLTHIPINPGGEPKYEDLIPVPPEALTLMELVNREMDDASGLQEAGQGLQAPNVNSGRQALAIVSQVHAGLSDLKQSAERGYVRGCRIQLQLIGNFYSVPRQVAWQGTDGSYKVKRFMGSDLGSTRDVRIKPGTMSMMPPIQKLQLAVQWGQLVQAGMAQADDLQEFVAGSVKGLTGLEDNPHIQRVRRQVEAWRHGPPEGWVEQAEAQQAAAEQAAQLGQQQAQQAGAMGMMPPPAAPPPPPVPPPTIFETLPIDTVPVVASIRVRELGRAMASDTFYKHPAVWRGVLVGMFQTVQQALTPPAPPPGAPGPAGAMGPPPRGPAPAPGAPPELMGPEAEVLGASAQTPAGL
jgi:hypothetical protein